MLPILALLLLTPLNRQQADDTKLQPPMSKAEQARKFHPVKVKGMSAEDWLKGYEQRLALEKDTPFSQIKWRSVGPESQSGRVVAAGSPLDKPEQLFVAFATGGLWRTENDGASWTPLFDHESSFAIGDFQVTKDGKTIWVGTGENNSQRTGYSGTGIFKSTDAGKTWKNMGLHESHQIGRIVIDPRNPETVYVGALGHLYSQNDERGVYKTTDGGKTWNHVLKIDDQTGVVDLVMDPRNSNVLYAAAWDRDRRAWDFRESGPGSAVYKTVNGGKTWSKLTGLPGGDSLGRTGLAICETKPQVVYAFVDDWSVDKESQYRDERTPSGTLTVRRFLTLTVDDLAQIDKPELRGFLESMLPSDVKLDDVMQRLATKKMPLHELRDLMLRKNPRAFDLDVVTCHVMRSDDAGKTWREMSGKMGEFGGYYEGRISVNPVNPNDIWVTGVILLRSKDGGKTWKQAAEDVHVDHHVLWIDPRNPKRLLDGNDGGPYLSLDDGAHWTHLNNLAVGQSTTIGVDDKTPYNIYTGMQDNGIMRGPSTHVSGESDPSEWTTVAGGDGSAIAVDPRDGGDVVYLASQFGSHFALNQKTGETWNVRAPDTPGEPRLRYNWISPILISPHHPDIVYLGSQMLHRSLTQGRTYESLSGDLTKNKPNGNVPFSTLTTISESPFKFGLLYVGADDGTVKMSPNHGSTWIDIATPQPDRWVTRIVASKYDKATVYCSQNGYRQDDFAPYVWKSTDYGKTWKSIAGNLPNECVNTIREDPNKEGVLYVGTDLGVFVSFDGGASWEVLGGGLPHVPVHDLVIQPRADEMAIATHARGVWVLRLKDLRDVTPDLRAKDLFLWPIADMPRNRRWGYEYRMEWDKEPPAKPTVGGRFWSKAAGKAFVRIKLVGGKVLKEEQIDAARGFNWFTIDLELGPAKDTGIDTTVIQAKTPSDKLKDPFEADRAVFLPVGEYRIEIAMGEKTAVTAWKLTAPPATPQRRGRRRGTDDTDDDTGE